MCWRIRHLHEVRLVEKPNSGVSGNQLWVTYAALDWLNQRGWIQGDAPGEPWDWDINMHGGEIGYTSFFFKDGSKAIEFKLRWHGTTQ
jgi:hypothetical protein